MLLFACQLLDLITACRFFIANHLISQLFFIFRDCILFPLYHRKLALELFNLAGLLSELALSLKRLVLSLIKGVLHLDNFINSVFGEHRKVLGCIVDSSVDVSCDFINFLAGF